MGYPSESLYNVEDGTPTWIGIVLIALGYFFYSKFIAEKIYQLDPNFETPAHALQDDVHASFRKAGRRTRARQFHSTRARVGASAPLGLGPCCGACRSSRST